MVLRFHKVGDLRFILKGHNIVWLFHATYEQSENV